MLAVPFSHSMHARSDQASLGVYVLCRRSWRHAKIPQTKASFFAMYIPCLLSMKSQSSSMHIAVSSLKAVHSNLVNVSCQHACGGYACCWVDSHRKYHGVLLKTLSLQYEVIEYIICVMYVYVYVRVRACSIFCVGVSVCVERNHVPSM